MPFVVYVLSYSSPIHYVTACIAKRKTFKSFLYLCTNVFFSASHALDTVRIQLQKSQSRYRKTSKVIPEVSFQGSSSWSLSTKNSAIPHHMKTFGTSRQGNLTSTISTYNVTTLDPPRTRRAISSRSRSFATTTQDSKCREVLSFWLVILRPGAVTFATTYMKYEEATPSEADIWVLQRSQVNVLFCYTFFQ